MKLPFSRDYSFGVICILFCVVFLHKEVTAQKKPFTKTLPYDSASVPRAHNADFKHLRLEVSFDPSLGKVFGKVTHLFSPIQKKVDTLFLDAPGISIKEVIFRGQKLPFSVSPKGLTLRFNPALTWDTEDSVVISYEATPRKGLYFIGWNDSKNISRKQIWSQGQGIDNRYWIPMYDEMNDKITSELIITMPKPYKVLSNGVRLGIRENGNDNIWHYRMNKPHAPYLIMIGIGGYEIETRYSKRGVREDLWFYPEWKERVNTTYQYSTEMIDFFEKEIGVNYPWENYSQIPVQDFMYGAMENTSATLFGDFLHVNDRSKLDRSYVAVNAHELAHQWFGDLVTARSPTHHWLQESFATHYNMLFEREVFGQDHFDIGRRRANLSALKESEKDLFNVANSKAGSIRHYPKGAFVLEMLKYVVGRDAYNRSVKHYLEKHGFGNVDTEDLLVAFHETIGESLDWFWEEWLYRGGEPFYEVQTKESIGKVEFTVLQPFSSDTPSFYFKMPIEFEIHYADGSFESKRLWVEGHETKVVLNTNPKKKIAYCLFDPNSQVLKAIKFKKSFEHLKNQALTARYMLDRLDAVEALVDFPMENKRTLLLEIFGKENTPYVKAAVIAQLSKDLNKKSQQMVNLALADKDVSLRKAAVALFDTIPKHYFKAMEKLLLNEPSYELQNSVLNKLAISNPSQLKKYLDLTKDEKGNDAHNFRISWLKWAIKNGNKEFEKELVDYASLSFDFLTRKNALDAIKYLKLVNTETLIMAINASESTNQKLQGDAVAFLNWAFHESNSWKGLIENLSPKGQMEDWKQEIWKRIRADKKG